MDNESPSSTATGEKSTHEPPIISFGNSGDGPLRVPGFGAIPLDYELPSDARFAHGIKEWRQAPAVTARELAMTAVMNRLTDRPNWHVDVFDDVAVAHWRQDSTASIAMNPLLSDRAWEWCVQELRDKATEFQQKGHIRVLDTGSCVCKSDHIPALQTGELAGEFRRAVKPVLRSLMESGLLDWRSRNRLSIVDPTLFPLVYGHSLVLTDGGRVEVANMLGAYQGATSLAPTHVDKRTDSADLQRQIDNWPEAWWSLSVDHETVPHYRWSANYQVLPSEVEFIGDAGSTQVRLASYINNLHPMHRGLYRAIETLIGRAIPLWNDCLVQGQRGWTDIMNQGQLGPVPLRIITYGPEWENELPECLLAFRIPSETRRLRYRRYREQLLNSAEDNTAEGRKRYKFAKIQLIHLSDVPRDEKKELPSPDSHLWQRAKEYLELPEDGSATPVPAPDDWQQKTWSAIERKAERVVRFRHPEPGTAFSYEEWKTGRHHERAVVDLVRKRKEWRCIPYNPFTPPHKPYTIRLEDMFRSQGLQVIVNMENIELTPESPDYKGTDWHMEGQLNEHLVAIAVFAYDIDNITEPKIAFRQNSKLDETFYHYRAKNKHGKRWDRLSLPAHRYGKDCWSDLKEIAEILGIPAWDLHTENWDSRTWQDTGVVSVAQGRLITFPNILEHRAEPVSLADRCRPGHYRYIKLYLVDPHYRVCSTRNVPPQQHHWWAQAVGEDLSAAGLPLEMIDQIMKETGSWPMGSPEARRHRRAFLNEHRWNNMVRMREMEFPYFDCWPYTVTERLQ
ncbi:hypothetical protein AtubIFM55763_004600 [Aspergillus tubingensis]|uniref:Uncharacterized protein n=1 Tax=Aspergillus tubingensis TaxID=5068 RepID=A0A8H3SZR1_ASPTU|nr:sugar (and other) transporter family protein [Aspergillus tubingensis]GFN18196.1 sugar (and other) transporter family protein [Aspergillus tubingensis]GLA59286.1 hypothetical protein AtubIFM54640_010402 [Aspergillus tubingensis]GLA73670.1 hypothetical protein AtubIFM55763_004600 [Aspergillus tubingensis]GLA89822.1 hypothetical protein AtubIFM56815_004313 [Aspergillus tubingensis]GLA97846.1 hypothetical protein AtubIFM57143_005778 [Aspergillus tubingensis]